MSYYLEDHPNPNFTQYGWPRTRVSGVIGVHTTESGVIPAGADPGAENTAGFISRRPEPGSYHALADWDTRIKLVRPRYAAWADITNNAHAMSVSGAMNAARWRDLSPERAAGIVRNMGIAAAELVLDAIADGLLDAPPPARRITAAEAIAGTKPGFYGHGETNPGTRYDPGQNFDWDLFLATYAAAIGGGIQSQSTTAPKEWDEMATAEEIAAIVRRVVWGGPGGTMIHNYRLGRGEYPETTLGALEGRMQNEILPAVVVGPLQQQLGGLAAKVDALATALAAKPDNPLTKEEALAQLDASVKASFGEYTPVLVKTDTVTEGAASNG